MSTPDGRGLLIGALVAAGCVVTLGVLVAGPVQIGAPIWTPERVTPTPIELPGATAPGLPPAAHANPVIQQVIGIVLQVVFLLAVAGVVTALVVFIVRRIRQRRRLLRRREATGDSGGGVVTVTGGAVPAPVMRRGISRALQILDERREPSDAVVQAWLGLEETASDAGAGRRASETPAEYTARIVQRFDTDRDAARALLRLYQDVRFGGRISDATSVALARDCLLRLESSWHETEAARQ